MVARLFAVAALAASAIAVSAATSEPFKIGVTVTIQPSGPESSYNKTYFLTKTKEISECIASGLTCRLSDNGAVKGTISCDDNLSYFFNENHPLEKELRPWTIEEAKKFENEGFAMMKQGFHQSNNGWTIGTDKKITWHTTKPSDDGVGFSVAVPFGTRVIKTPPKALFAEICTSYHHPDQIAFVRGTAKAYFAADEKEVLAKSKC